MWVRDKVMWFLACWQQAVNDVVMVYIYPSLDAREERQDCEITAGPCHLLPCWVRQTHTGLCTGLSGEVARQAPGGQKNPQAPPKRLCGEYQAEKKSQLCNLIARDRQTVDRHYLVSVQGRACKMATICGFPPLSLCVWPAFSISIFTLSWMILRHLVSWSQKEKELHIEKLWSLISEWL